ncbi:MAG: CDC48 family AAA ATPase [Candidatus Methanomethylophilaceae archaeon]|nr:CDC48 family AAA ATPase [Candidatus Methanomethylophilaceae archaeon]
MEDCIELKVAANLRKLEAGHGRVRLDPVAASKLGLEIGDIVEITGKQTSVAKVMKGAPDDEGKGIIRMDSIIMNNIKAKLDDNVKVRKISPNWADKVVLEPASLPAGKKMAFQEGKDKFFKEGLNGRPLLKGDVIVIPNIAIMGDWIRFTVTNTVPAGIVAVTAETEIVVNDSPGKKEKLAEQITFDDVGGLDEELKKIREIIELPLRHPEIFDRLCITPPKGVLLYGPPGTGKTLIAKAVASGSGASFYSIQGPEIMGKFYGESEESLRKVFKEAEENSPSIIFIDEIDSIAPNRDAVTGEVERRVVAQLLTLMDGLSSGKGDVVVIAATNREDAIDPALRRPGRFDREIEIGIPGRDGRKDILEVHMRGMPLTDDVSIDKLASMTHGFVGADLASLAREAAMKCLSRNIKDFDLEKTIPIDLLAQLKVSMNDFTSALSDVEPSGMREVIVDIPKTEWSDVGGLESVKKEIREVFIPTEDKKAFERLGIRPPKGILFYGPPGTGKTLIAKAVANDSGANFICINGPEIASKWMGETEKAIRQIFKRAKQMAPCIIFFDEIDSIAPKRGMSDNSAWERAVNQLLTSMDGVESLDNVTVMAATNRPDMIDPALLRPGRFDKLVFIGKPDLESRLRILEVHTKNMPIMDVDLLDVAEKTDGYVGADLEALCREAAMTAFRDNPSVKFVNRNHFNAALKVVKPSVDTKMMENYVQMATEIRKRKSSLDDFPFYG